MGGLPEEEQLHIGNDETKVISDQRYAFMPHCGIYRHHRVLIGNLPPPGQFIILPLGDEKEVRLVFVFISYLNFCTTQSDNMIT